MTNNEKIFITLFSICILFIQISNQTKYYRCEKEPITPHPRDNNNNTNQITQPIKVAIAHPYKRSITNLPFLLDGLLYKMNTPILFELEEINLRKWRENNSIIITAGSLDAYFDELEKEGLKLNIGVIHLQDSFCPSEEEIPLYNKFYSKAKFILRNNYCGSYFKEYKNVYFLPVGWINNPDITMMNFFDNNNINDNFIPTTIDKVNDFVFIGSANGNRSLVETIIKGYINKYPHYIYHLHPSSIKLEKKEEHWITPTVYNNHLMNSHFGLVVDTLSAPAIESPRFYETISHGAIPLSCSLFYFFLSYLLIK